MCVRECVCVRISVRVRARVNKSEQIRLGEISVGKFYLFEE